MKVIPALKVPGAAQGFRDGWQKGRGGPEVSGHIPVAIVGFAGREKDVQAIIVDGEGKVSATDLGYLIALDPEVDQAIELAARDERARPQS